MSTSRRIAYGMLGAPLAMAALPVYIHAPRLYGDDFGLGLAMTGFILLLSRSVDTLQDPWLGRLADFMQRRPGGWPIMMAVAAACLGLSYAALFNPPGRGDLMLPLWLGITLVLVYTAHSALNITYLAWGAVASDDSDERTRLVAYREGFALLGVILASLLPMLLANWFDSSWIWLLFSIIFAGVLGFALWVLLQHAPAPKSASSQPQNILQPLTHEPFRRLAILFLLNGFAVAIAATLSLFYIADVLQLESWSGAFLALYFVSGACSLPLWLYIARRIGKILTWMAGTIAAVSAFIWAVQLGAGDLVPYAIVCVLSGAALGTDLAMPAAIAADIIPREERGRSGSYFGIWSLINKGVLALAAGIALPMLAGLGYKPGEAAGLTALAVFYAGVPCVIKLLSITLLLRWRSSLEVKYAD